MIESRYKIEYILPDDEIKKSSPFKVLWYLLLIPLILLAVVAITYDFSIQNIARDSSALVEKAKVHIFNLGEQKQFEKPQIKTNPIVEKILIPKPKPVVAVTKQKIIESKTLIDTEKDQKTINELAAKQKEQQKRIQEQLSQNKKLSQSINSLSTELVREKTKNDSLNSKLTEQEKDRLELEEQLNKILAESEKNEIELEQLIEKPVSEAIVESKDSIMVKTEEKVVSAKVEESIKVQEPIEDKVVVQEEIENKISDNSVDKKIIEQPEPKDSVALISEQIKPTVIKEKEPEKPISETDKIIQAMSSIKSNTLDNTEEPTKPSLVIENSANIKNESTSNIVDKVTENKSTKLLFAIGNEDINDEKTTKDIVKSSSSSIQIETDKLSISKQSSIEALPVNATPVTIKVENKIIETKTENEIETKSAIIETPKPTSPVDAIIAAMQASASNKTSPSTENDNIDLELEKEIKQQLVEQGDLSIDN